MSRVVLLWYDVCWCYGVVRLGWCGILMQAEAVLYCIILYILYHIIYCVVFSDNCMQIDDGQKQYLMKHAVDILCIIDNIVVL